MRCAYCTGKVVGQPDVVVVSGLGPAHENCYQRSQISLAQRTFAGMDLTQFSSAALNELSDMVAIEQNARKVEQASRVVLFD